MFRSALIATLICVGQFSYAQVVLGDLPLENNPNLANSVQNVSHSAEVLISRKQYVLSYNKDRRNPNWVAWKLEKADMGNVPRQKYFSTDVALEQFLQSEGSDKAVTAYDYKGSCFDRGHQVPSADRDATVEDNKATFLMSNVTPQTAYINRQVWADLEQYTRNQVIAGKKAYVIAGPLYDEDFGKIGPSQDISVPSKSFKLVVFLNPEQSLKDVNPETDVIAVEVPNLTSKGTKPQEDNETLCSDFQVKSQNVTLAGYTSWKKYQSSLAKIEQLSGFKFFSF